MSVYSEDVVIELLKMSKGRPPPNLKANKRARVLMFNGRSPFEELCYCSKHKWISNEDVRHGKLNRLLCPYCFRSLRVKPRFQVKRGRAKQRKKVT